MRAARVSDAPLLAHWDSLPHVIAASGEDDATDWYEELARDIDWAWDFIAEVDGRAIGIVQIIDPEREESHYWGEVEANLRAIDIWIGEVDCLARGYGTQMMQYALDFCFAELAVTGVLIDPLESNVRAINFYRRMGFREVGPRRFGKDDCLVMRIDRIKPDFGLGSKQA